MLSVAMFVLPRQNQMYWGGEMMFFVITSVLQTI